MIFLVVKVNCPSYVFNISKSIWILFASDDVMPGKQTMEQAIGVLSETLHYTTLQ